MLERPHLQQQKKMGSWFFFLDNWNSETIRADEIFVRNGGKK